MISHDAKRSTKPWHIKHYERTKLGKISTPAKCIELFSFFEVTVSCSLRDTKHLSHLMRKKLEGVWMRKRKKERKRRRGEHKKLGTHKQLYCGSSTKRLGGMTSAQGNVVSPLLRGGKGKHTSLLHDIFKGLGWDIPAAKWVFAVEEVKIPSTLPTIPNTRHPLAWIQSPGLKHQTGPLALNPLLSSGWIWNDTRVSLPKGQGAKEWYDY